MDLNVNHRSGGDVWYSDLLSSCREGNMSLSDWQFLHGLPTNECGSWLVRQNTSLCGNPQCTQFKEKTKAARLESPERWYDEAQKYECQVCVCKSGNDDTECCLRFKKATNKMMMSLFQFIYRQRSAALDSMDAYS